MSLCLYQRLVVSFITLISLKIKTISKMAYDMKNYGDCFEINQLNKFNIKSIIENCDSLVSQTSICQEFPLIIENSLSIFSLIKNYFIFLKRLQNIIIKRYTDG